MGGAFAAVTCCLISLSLLACTSGQAYEVATPAATPATARRRALEHVPRSPSKALGKLRQVKHTGKGLPAQPDAAKSARQHVQHSRQLLHSGGGYGDRQHARPGERNHPGRPGGYGGKQHEAPKQHHDGPWTGPWGGPWDGAWEHLPPQHPGSYGGGKSLYFGLTRGLLGVEDYADMFLAGDESAGLSAAHLHAGGLQRPPRVSLAHEGRLLQQGYGIADLPGAYSLGLLYTEDNGSRR